MRAKDFLKENINVDDYQKVWSMIQQNCQPFINEIGGIEELFSLPLFRGSVTAAQNTSIKLIYCPVNRTPRDTALSLHKAADNWFKSNTGIAFRSNALFATGDVVTAKIYGARQYYEVLIPLGNFHYCWAKNIRDMTETFEISPINDNESEEEFVWNILDEGEYFLDAHLESAILSGNEIMINCKEAYLIKPEFFYLLRDKVYDGDIE